MRVLSRLTVSIALTLAALSNSFAGETKVGNLVIVNPTIPATVASAPVAAGHLVIKNNGAEDDRLIGVSAGFSGKQEIHTMKMIDGVMRMRPLKDGVIIPAGEEIALEKGGDHLMFMKLGEQMKENDTHSVTLKFEKAGDVILDFVVVDRMGKGHGDHSDHSGHGDHKDHSSHSDHSSHNH